MAYVTRNLSELWIISAGFDDLLVNGETTDADGNTYTIDAIDDGASWDSPVPVDVAVQRWMTDGAVAATQGHENRTPTFQVRITADTSSTLAAAEAALVKRSAQPCLLKWVPPEGSPEAPATVFEVWTWHLSHTFNGTDEAHLQRYYTLTFTAKPWARSEDLTTAVAPIPPPTSTTIQVDACTSTTGWTGEPVSPVTSAGAVKVSFFGGGAFTIDLIRNGLVTGMDVTPYLMLDISSVGDNHGPNRVQPSVYLDNGNYLTAVAQLGTVYYFKMPTGKTSFTRMVVRGFFYSPMNTTMTWQIADVSRTDTIGGVGSLKQLARLIEVGGSVKTSGSIQLASPSATALGTCLVYTCSDEGTGYTPPLRQYRATGNVVTPDSATVSGARETFVATGGTSVGVVTFNVPAKLLPEATYVVVARIICGTSTNMQVTIAGRHLLDTSPQVVTSTVTATGAGPVWAVLGAISMPSSALPAESGQLSFIQASATADTGPHSLDEIYLFDVTNGTFTLVTKSTATRLWIDAPDVDAARNRPGIFVGTADDRSDAITPEFSTILSIGDHDLAPDGSIMFTVTDGVDSALANASFYRRWHTHAGS